MQFFCENIINDEKNNAIYQQNMYFGMKWFKHAFHYYSPTEFLPYQLKLYQ